MNKRTSRTCGLLLMVLAFSFAFIACDSQSTQVQTESEQPLAKEALFRGIIFGQGDVARTIPEIRNHRLMTDLVQTDEQLKAVRAFNTELMGAVLEARPGYLDEFNAAIKSGNHQRIAETLEEAGSVIAEALPRMQSVKNMVSRIESDPAYQDKLVQNLARSADGTGLTEEDFKTALVGLISGNLNPEQLRTGPQAKIVGVALAVVAAAFVSTVAVAINYVAGVNVAAAINAATQVNVGLEPVLEPASVEKMSMYEEKLVNSIATTYAAK